MEEEGVTGQPEGEGVTEQPEEAVQAETDVKPEVIKTLSIQDQKPLENKLESTTIPAEKSTVTIKPVTSSSTQRSHSRKKRPKNPKKCAEPPKWECETESLWRTYMRIFSENAEKRVETKKAALGLFGREKCPFQPRDIPRSPCPEMTTHFEFNAFNIQKHTFIHRGSELVDTSKLTAREESEFDWPTLWPCSSRDVVREQKIADRKKKAKEMGALPCEIDEIDSPESSDDERLKELAHKKELVHARIPCRRLKPKTPLVDRASGEEPGLVEGEYVKLSLLTKKGISRTYANACLRGLTGMHLNELLRVREHTWKFCLYQALVALLTKTQLRYKFTWSANVDYIYQHAWLLFLHMGYLNVKPNQRFDDVLVYNYKYSVELELVHELEDVPIVHDVTFKYVEKSLKKQKLRPRKELSLAKSGFGTDKEKDHFKLLVNKGTKKIEVWFNKLDVNCTNCILRTPRFSLAFWQDGSFWYLYNPYRCDKFGFWNDFGFASIMKFCSKESLKRHLMILILRAYVYEATSQSNEDIADIENKSLNSKPITSNKSKEEVQKFSLQIFELIYHSCQIHNVKLYQRSRKKPKAKLVEKQESDPCTFDPLAKLSPLPCGTAIEDEKLENVERPRWLEDNSISWTKSLLSQNNNNKPDCGKTDFTKWHNFDVVKPRRLHVLWGNIHITDRMFAEENRNEQAEACYIVCAGMIRINAPEYWSGEILNAIIICGDKLYTERNHKYPNPNDWSSQPNDRFHIGNTQFDFSTDLPVTGRLFVRTNNCLWQSLHRFFQNHRFAILTCENSCLGLFKHCGAYFACDVGSYGPPIFERGNGSAYLLRASCLEGLVRCLVLLIGSNECSDFELRPVEIGKIEVIDDDCTRKKIVKCPEEIGTAKNVCPFEEEKKKSWRKGRRPLLEEKKYCKTICSKKNDD